VIGWLLDTNVVSELARRTCDAGVAAWALSQPEEAMFVSVLTLAEYDKGVHNLEPGSAGRARLTRAVDALAERFAGRILSLEDRVVRRWGRISGDVKRTTGMAPPVIDTMLAATAIEHDLYLVTRNVKDVRDSGAAVFDPWNDEADRFELSRG
jgi:predicted nucleic acid-binding protein